MNGQIIILAAGKGTRMNGGGVPKVLVELNQKPMIEYVLTAVRQIGMEREPLIVVGFEADKIKDYVGNRAGFVHQTEQLGTGHAVSITREHLAGFDGPIAVLYGDHPLVKQETLQQLFNLHSNNVLTMMTTEVNDFDGWRQGFYNFGRIIRDVDESILSIREVRDCSLGEHKIKEVNPGYYCFDSSWLWQNIDKLRNDNNQSEYYLTDLVELAVKQGIAINSLKISPVECLGINTKEQLTLVEGLMNV